jgi:hypothetical protein
MLEGWLPHLNLIDITICAQWPSTHILKSKNNNIWPKIAPNKCLYPECWTMLLFPREPEIEVCSETHVWATTFQLLLYFLVFWPRSIIGEPMIKWAKIQRIRKTQKALKYGLPKSKLTAANNSKLGLVRPNHNSTSLDENDV